MQEPEFHQPGQEDGRSEKMTATKTRARPRSIKELSERMKELLTGKLATDLASVTGAAAIEREAGEYDLEYRLGIIASPVLNKARGPENPTTVHIRCRVLRQTGDKQPEAITTVHPILAAYFARYEVIERLSRELRDLDTHAKWDDAESIAECLCNVLRGRTENSGKEPRKERPPITIGRLRMANPGLAEKLEKADHEARQYETQRTMDARLSGQAEGQKEACR